VARQRGARWGCFDEWLFPGKVRCPAPTLLSDSNLSKEIRNIDPNGFQHQLNSAGEDEEGDHGRSEFTADEPFPPDAAPPAAPTTFRLRHPHRAADPLPL